MLNAVRLLVIYFAVNLHGGQVYFCYFAILKNRWEGLD